MKIKLSEKEKWFLEAMQFRDNMKKPRCVICGKRMKKYIDPSTKKQCSHTWQNTCKCVSPNLLLSVG